MIVQALASAARRAECDLLLLVRGGGSLEDLWAFNDEALARAIAASPIPVISGVGHETDLTIADLVSDSRAATPTAAAELATAGWVAAAADLRQLASALTVTLRAGLERRMQRVDMLATRLVHPRQRMLATGKDLDHLASRLAAAGRRRIDERKAKLSNLATAFNALSPQATLARGYALVRDPSGQLVRSQRQIEAGMSLVLRFAEGGAETLVKRIIPD
jgi:exodeoxyribonuclease VII large subunit